MEEIFLSANSVDKNKYEHKFIKQHDAAYEHKRNFLVEIGKYLLNWEEMKENLLFIYYINLKTENA